MSRVGIQALVIVLLLVAISISYLIPTPFSALGLAAFLIFIALFAIVADLWREPTSYSPITIVLMGRAREEKERRKRQESGQSDNLSRMVSIVSRAARGGPYSKGEIAEVLREALLTKHYGTGAFPQTWVTTKDGNPAIKRMLDSVNRTELMDVLESPDRLAREGTRFSFLRNSNRVSSVYLSKVDNVLKMLETGS